MRTVSADTYTFIEILSFLTYVRISVSYRCRSGVARRGGHISGRIERGANAGAQGEGPKLHVPDGGQPYDETHH